MSTEEVPWIHGLFTPGNRLRVRTAYSCALGSYALERISVCSPDFPARFLVSIIVILVTTPPNQPSDPLLGRKLAFSQRKPPVGWLD
jgi:hypothetical protein